jgi:hypothetical protein
MLTPSVSNTGVNLIIVCVLLKECSAQKKATKLLVA